VGGAARALRGVPGSPRGPLMKDRLRRVGNVLLVTVHVLSIGGCIVAGCLCALRGNLVVAAVSFGCAIWFAETPPWKYKPPPT
jgi:hypothetical protein